MSLLINTFVSPKKNEGSIHYNISIQSLVNAGWQIIYNKGYDHKSTNEEILEIKDEYSSDLNSNS